MPYISLLLFLLFSGLLSAQEIPGCADPRANNYNHAATMQDGSCTYNLTIYNPPFKYKLPAEVNETSGLVYFRGLLWTINDSGNEPVLYGLDPQTGEIFQRIRIGNAKNVDWEDLAQDENFIYIGDFGNNSGGRKFLQIYRVPKKAIPTKGDETITSDKIVFNYPDYQGKPEKKKQTNFDCEAFVVIDSTIHLFTKNWGDHQTKHYRLPARPGRFVAELLFTFDARGLITAADYNPATHELLLLGYTKNEWVPFFWLLFDFQGDDFFSGNKRRIDLLNIFATQTEGICFTDGRNGVITSEGNKAFSQSAYDFRTKVWTAPESRLAGGEQAADFGFLILPATEKENRIELVFDSMPVGQFQLELYDAQGNPVRLKKYKMLRKEGRGRIRLKVRQLEPGIYVLRLVSGNRFVEHKFVKE